MRITAIEQDGTVRQEGMKPIDGNVLTMSELLRSECHCGALDCDRAKRIVVFSCKCEHGEQHVHCMFDKETGMMMVACFTCESATIVKVAADG